MPVPGALGNLLFLSPHCDDAVFSCGDLLAVCAGSIVATVCAGPAPAGAPMTEWDLAGGFRPGEDVTGLRRAEDLAALSILGCVPLWLDFRDRQYEPSHSLEDLRAAVVSLVTTLRPSAIFIPLGLFHSDHLSVHEAARRAAHSHRDRPWYLYEDAIYRRLPGLVGDRIDRIRKEGYDLESVAFPGRYPSERKMQAVQRYGSQIRALSAGGRPGHLDVLGPERYWRLVFPAAGIPAPHAQEGG